MTPLEVAILTVACLVLVGAFVVIWIARPWDHGAKRKDRPKNYTIHLDGSKYFTEVDEIEINRLVHEKLQGATDEAIEQFRGALETTMPKLVDDVRSLHAAEVRKTFANYSRQFEALNEEAVETFSQIHDDLMKRHKELSDGLDKRAVADYKFRMSVFDKRLDDIVSGYVLESLGSQVDLGAQLPYILSKIEENKEQIKRDMTL